MSKTMKRLQGGGTLTGLLLGVLLSVLVAVVVAVYVARIPVPFLNRASTHTSLQDAAEAERNRDWNPNAVLQGSTLPNSGAVVPMPDAAPIPAPGEAQQADGSTSGQEPPALATGTVTPVTAGSDRPAPADPLGDLVAAHTAPPAPVAPAAQGIRPDPFLYFVQAGAFRTAQDAEAQRVRLSLAGVQARVTEREQAGRAVYRVRVGPFDTRDAATSVQVRLDAGGFDAALVRVQR